MVNDELYDPLKVFDPLHAANRFPLISRATAFARVMPSYFIVGVQKGGTSSLYGAFMQHPAVLPAKQKETFFFGNTTNYNKGLNWYRQYYATKFFKRKYERSHQCNAFSIDASTDSFDSPEAPLRIKQNIPGAKIIIILRNPVKRAFSHYQMSRRLGFELADFKKALELENERIKNAHLQPLADKNHNYVFQRLGYRSRGIYINYIRQWYEVFGEKNVMTISSEDFFKAPQQVFDQLTDFLSIGRKPSVNFEKVNADPAKEKMDAGIARELYDFYKPHNDELFKFLGTSYEWE